LAGSAILDAPAGAELFARLDAASYADLNDDEAQNANEPSAPMTMGFLKHGSGNVVVVTDTNMLQSVPQPLVDNIVRAPLPELAL
jgi:hypothetical protein